MVWAERSGKLDEVMLVGSMVAFGMAVSRLVCFWVRFVLTVSPNYPNGIFTTYLLHIYYIFILYI